jgi:hypothetical protein
MAVQVETQSGSTYVFSDDGGTLVERRSANPVRGARPGFMEELPVQVQHGVWPPVVGRRLMFTPAGSGGVVQTSNVTGVSEV